jgi:hypothetical protein
MSATKSKKLSLNSNKEKPIRKNLWTKLLLLMLWKHRWRTPDSSTSKSSKERLKLTQSCQMQIPRRPWPICVCFMVFIIWIKISAHASSRVISLLKSHLTISLSRPSKYCFWESDHRQFLWLRVLRSQMRVSARQSATHMEISTKLTSNGPKTAEWIKQRTQFPMDLWNTWCPFLRANCDTILNII